MLKKLDPKKIILKLAIENMAFVSSLLEQNTDVAVVSEVTHILLFI